MPRCTIFPLLTLCAICNVTCFAAQSSQRIDILDLDSDLFVVSRDRDSNSEKSPSGHDDDTVDDYFEDDEYDADFDPDYADKYSDTYLANLAAPNDWPTFPRPCPCADVTLCERIKTKPKVEIFGYSYIPKNWPHYDWSKLTTIVTHYHDDQLLCHARKNGVRVSFQAPLIGTKATMNPTLRSRWVNATVNLLINNYLDGVNVDHEAWFGKGPQHQRPRDAVTDMVRELNESFAAKNLDIQLTMATPRNPNCYNITALSKYIDFFFIMSYKKPQGGLCTFTGPYDRVTHGIRLYLNIGVPASKLVMGVPWYGWKCKCTKYNMNTTACHKEKGKPTPMDWSEAKDVLLPESFTGPLWDDVAKCHYGAIKNRTTGQISQFWYPDPETLQLRYSFIRQMALRGVGIFQLDWVDYDKPSEVAAIWGGLP